ncbi:MAG: T9SS type A sorting domain-containing protein [Bacteroidales bacterium]|nr:T9SS type A sorting domain-containing protein [Bacteroidales bacterium]
MKKLFTLALALSVAFVGYSQVAKVSKNNDALKMSAQQITVTGSEMYQNVGSQPNIARSDMELDYTYYDWQTNTAGKNQTMHFPDGCVGFSYVYSGNASHTDRGTNIVIYDPAKDEWTTSGGSIESHKTGFGCSARYGENGIVVVSRNPETYTCEVYIIEDKDNLAYQSVDPIYVMPGSQTEHNPHFPAVMCTGPDHKHIHILVTALDEVTEDGQTNPFYYFRSMDGGETWEEYMKIPELGRDFAPTFGSGQDAYFIENNGENYLGIVVNTRRGNGIVLTSFDEGNTWETTEYYHHPGIDVDFGDPSNGGTLYLYPRWTSALYDNNGKIRLAYTFNGGSGDATSTSYYPLMGGVVYWTPDMPYRGTEPLACDPNNPMPCIPGQPFIADSAYLREDIQYSWFLFSDAPHEMWPEYVGYLTALDENEQPPVDPYDQSLYDAAALVEMYNGLGIDSHGHYNGGLIEMPVLMMTPDNTMMVAVWIGLDQHHIGGETNSQYFFKIFARASFDNGESWTPMKHLTYDFMYELSECVYPQAAIAGNNLVIAVQMDQQPDSYLIGSGGDTNPDDNYYQGLTFDLTELFGYDGVEEQQVVNNTAMSIYPNPATDQLYVTLNQNTEIVIYNIMGQKVMSQEGRIGNNALNISSLNAGIYFVNAGTQSQKFIVK